MSSQRLRVLIPISEPLGGQMSAVGIRKWEIGKALVDVCDVTFACAAPDNDSIDGARIEPCRTERQLRRLARQNHVLYTLGVNPRRLMAVTDLPIRFIVDLYTPLATEILESFPSSSTKLLRAMHQRIVRWSLAQIGRADFVVCSNETQRDFWLGMLTSIGRLDAGSFRRSPDCRDLIDVVPFGMQDGRPTTNGKPLRKRLGFSDDDFVLLWTSKILGWQDPVTLLKAMNLIRKDHPAIRLVFLGIGPYEASDRVDSFDPASYRTLEALRLSDELGLTDQSVFFVRERVPYRDIGAHYADSNATIATYPDTLETRFCIGSRLYEYIWAGLPVITTGGRLQRELIDDQDVGITTVPHAPELLAEAIVQTANGRSQSNGRENKYDQLRESMSWRTIVEPIRRFCLNSEESHWPKRTYMRTCFDVGEFYVRSLAIRAARKRLSD